MGQCRWEMQMQPVCKRGEEITTGIQSYGLDCVFLFPNADTKIQGLLVPLRVWMTKVNVFARAAASISGNSGLGGTAAVEQMPGIIMF